MQHVPAKIKQIQNEQMVMNGRSQEKSPQITFNQINFNKALKSTPATQQHSVNTSVHVSYHGERNSGIAQTQQQKHRHTNSGGHQVVSSLKNSLIANNNPFVSINGGTIDSNFRGHAKNAMSMGTYENSAKLVKRNNYMSGNSSLKSSQNSSTYGFQQ